ncbi:histidinol-phosphate transaminase [Nitratidesulfovibrio liaohensis]|uniref:Histidinol-phosphate aminotransferase n=1 Tax=Nitratidesulfovibrio liaohensis TaxID=2604158 RepID=A0ABY9R735_9BACT|nr:histidinol-phosphate transaminase [Nitratidesulfovibrio liaohensis]WMW66524.1 histidinol-phosphate transaminase [Nitratidesulfovibrio liaohensis]
MCADKTASAGAPTGLPLASPSAVRPEVCGFKPYTPGLSIDEIRDRYGLAHVIKLASNENPLGTSPVVQHALRHKANLAFRYAQSGNPRLTAAIAAHHGVPAECVVAGNGSDEIIDLIVRVRAVPGVHNVVAFNPCFSIYELQTRLAGVEFRQTPLAADFSFDWDGLMALVDDATAVVFVTTPDNPSGFCPPVADLERLARALPSGCLLVVDEAYMDFCGDESAHSLLGRIDEFPNLAVLRTFSKSFGLAGLRLGYGILPVQLADYLRRVRLPFSVNILAEEAGLAALADDVFRAETLRVTSEGRAALTEGLTALGCHVYPSKANFVMFRPAPASSPSSSGGAAHLFEELLRRGIIIRPLKSYGLPDLLRVSVGSPDENAAFLKAAGEIMAHA